MLSWRKLSNRFANVLRDLRIGAGETVFSFAGRIPEVYIMALGALKARAVFSALFANFGEEPIRTRLSKGGGKASADHGTAVRAAHRRDALVTAAAAARYHRRT